MKSQFGLPFLLMLGALIIADPVLAHHGLAAYDLNKSISLTGTITKFDWSNPHIRFYFDVKDEKGKTSNWQGELPAPSMMFRLGWNLDTLKPGYQITVTGNPAKNGSTSIHPVILKVNGKEVKVGGGDEY